MINIFKIFVYALGVFAIVSCFNSNTPAKEDAEQIQSLPVSSNQMLPVRDENVEPKNFEEFLRIKLTRFFKFVSSKPEIFMIMSNNHNLVNNFSINTPQIILEIDYLKEEISDYIKKGVFPNFDVELFTLVIRPITDSLAQEMMSQKKIDINKYTEKCIKFLTKGLGV